MSSGSGYSTAPIASPSVGAGTVRRSALADEIQAVGAGPGHVRSAVGVVVGWAASGVPEESSSGVVASWEDMIGDPEAGGPTAGGAEHAAIAMLRKKSETDNRISPDATHTGVGRRRSRPSVPAG